jgi:hypothetical protein
VDPDGPELGPELAVRRRPPRPAAVVRGHRREGQDGHGVQRRAEGLDVRADVPRQAVRRVVESISVALPGGSERFVSRIIRGGGFLLWVPCCLLGTKKMKRTVFALFDMCNSEKHTVQHLRLDEV